MLVPLVLRSIVLPYLRSATAGQSAAVATSSRVRCVSLSTTARRTRAAEAYQENEDYGRSWEPPLYHVKEPPLLRPLLNDDRRRSVRVERRLESNDAAMLPLKSRDDAVSHAEGRPRQGESRAADRCPASPVAKAESAAAQPLASETTSIAPSSTPQRPLLPTIPPSVAKLLYARLFRMCAFHIINTPEYAADGALVTHVAEKMERAGAGKLAQRLRRGLELAPERGGKLRLHSDPDPRRNPPAHWRIPLTPRDISSYPHETEQQQRTHHHNLQLTRLLTVTHEVPYASPFPRHRKAELRRVRDVVHHVEYLQSTRGFVPDWVTVNIVLKAWLQCLSRERWRGQRTGSKELHAIFAVLSRNIEEGTSPLAATAEMVGNEGKCLNSRKEVKQKEGAFEASLSFERHVEPFAKLMRSAMAKVGDHDGRARVDEWMREMARRLGFDLDGRKIDTGGGSARSGKH